jgi:uncharacterized membrane protein
MITLVTPTNDVSAATASALALLAVLALIGLLFIREISVASPTPRARRLSQSLDMIIVPLLIVFVSALVAQMLRVFA